MKTKIFLLLNLLWVISPAFSQDVIYLLSGEEIKAIVKTLSDESVEYVKFNNPEGPKYVTNKSKIFKIKFANGEQEVFKHDTETPTNNSTTHSSYQIENGGTGNKNTTKVKSNDNDVIIDVGKIFDTSNTSNSSNSSTNSGGNGTTGSNPTSKSKETQPCFSNNTGDVKFANKTKNPLIVFIYHPNGEFIQSIDIPIGGEQQVYDLQVKAYNYQFHPSNSGQIDPATKKIIPYYESTGSFRVTQCDTIPVTLLR